MASCEIVEHPLGDMLARYIRYENENGMAFELLPASKRSLITEPREFLPDEGASAPEPARILRDNLLQIKLQDEPARQLSNGITLFDSQSTEALRYCSQETVQADGVRDIQTVFEHPRGLRCIHHVLYREGEPGVRIYSEVTNESKESVSLELLSSFVLGGITPFDEADAPGRLQLHRFRAWWSLEGKLETRTLEDLHLVRSWANSGARSERFGQVGMMPVRHFFPFIAAEDTVAGVVWGAKLAWAGSWQMEALRRGDTLTLTGGHADREFGHWMKTLVPGETLASPVARVACSADGLNDLCHRFLKMEERCIPDVKSEEDLPVLFNEWCTTWGSPTYDNVLAIADRLKDLQIKYFVIDDGWAERPEDAAAQSNGDWGVDSQKFPGGLKPVADALRERGIIPGLWFEFEVCNPGSKAWDETGHHLHRDGKVFTSGPRRFWDLKDPWVQDYLAERVIRLLKDSGFRYLKVDYNDTVSIGCDHPDSLGEGLRQHVLAMQDFFRKLRREMPDLVIENCASGGQRLEPSMMELVSMGSFSDAHEGVEIPVIAAVQQKLVSPRQMQIWAVLRKGDSAQRLGYSLAATFLGRMCLSGDVMNLSEEQMQIVRDGVGFYRAVAPVIKNGRSEVFGELPENYTRPAGWQAVVRRSDDGNSILMVVHSFKMDSAQEVAVPLPPGEWVIEKQFVQMRTGALCSDREFCLTLAEPFSGQAWLLRK